MEYKVGDLLIYVGSDTEEPFNYKNFIKNFKYEIFKIEEFPDDGPCLWFKGSDFGCFLDYAREKFIKLDEQRNDKINNILNV